MKKVIILEGPDNIGKSALARMIAKRYEKEHKLVVRHFGPPQGEGEKALQFQLNILHAELKQFDSVNCVEIWDRSVIGEAVYGPLYRQYDHQKYWEKLIQLKEIEKNILFFPMYADLSIYKKLRISKKSDEKGVYQRQAESKRVAIKFIDVATDLNLLNTVYLNLHNYGSLDLRNRYVLKRIDAWINGKSYVHNQTDDYTHTFFNPDQLLWKRNYGFTKWEYQCSMYEKEGECSVGVNHKERSIYGVQQRRPTSHCGTHINARYIFIGEAPGKEGCGKLGIPFYDDRSGNLFQSALDKLGIHPTQYYMTNVIKCCPENNDLSSHLKMAPITYYECVNELRHEILNVQRRSKNVKIIAIGKIASAYLGREGFDYATCYHPAYYLRIGRGDQFCQDLRTLL